MKVIKINILELLEKNNRSKYWLSRQMNIRYEDIDRLLNGEGTSISTRYIIELCEHLNCTTGELISIVDAKGRKSSVTKKAKI